MGLFALSMVFGAVGAAVLLRPVSDDMVKLYFASMLMATTMELITAKIMIRLFGAFWWDYSKKRCNYKGIICLESSLGWGLLGIIFFRILNVQVQNTVARIPSHVGEICGPGAAVFLCILTSSTASGWNFVKRIVKITVR